MADERPGDDLEDTGEHDTAAAAAEDLDHTENDGNDEDGA